MVAWTNDRLHPSFRCRNKGEGFERIAPERVPVKRGTRRDSVRCANQFSTGTVPKQDCPVGTFDNSPALKRRAILGKSLRDSLFIREYLVVCNNRTEWLIPQNCRKNKGRTCLCCTFHS